MGDAALVILARAPIAGRVKTRLAREFGDPVALQVYRDLLGITAAVAARWPGPVLLLSEGDGDAWQGSGLESLRRREQVAGGLGVRIAAALRAGLELAPTTIVIGSDCSELSVPKLEAVLGALDRLPVAFGPADDGGFWAVATSAAAVAQVIADGEVPWSTANTLAVVRSLLAARGLPSALGPQLRDCDTVADYEQAVALALLPERRAPLVPRRVVVVIPVLDEARALPAVIAEIPRDCVDEIVVVDNGSTDRSAEIARSLGARVVSEPRRGYGSACLAGIAATAGSDVVVFLDGDHSDYPQELRQLLAPILAGTADLVIGSRMLRAESRAALLPQARYGNRLAAWLLRVLFGIRCTDLGPFRAIRRPALLALGMQDRGYGWTVEMQLRARLAGLRVLELPVSYRVRIGQSKISGTLRGTMGAGWKILSTVFRYRLHPPRLPERPRN